jgi:hypothetical protein
MDATTTSDTRAGRNADPGWSRWLSAILLAGIVVLAMLLTKSGRVATALRTELKTLREVAGHLDVKDPNKIYAVRLSTDSPYEWAWRIYLPPGPELHLHEWTGRMPAEGCRTIRPGGRCVGRIIRAQSAQSIRAKSRFASR